MFWMNFSESLGMFSGKYRPLSGAKPFLTASKNETLLEL